MRILSKTYKIKGGVLAWLFAAAAAATQKRMPKPTFLNNQSFDLFNESTNLYSCLLLILYPVESKDISTRKTDHIDLAFEAQAFAQDTRFDYEPLLAQHPQKNAVPPTPLAGKILRAPIWVGSMTGGAAHAAQINRNLALACKEFGLGMGLGSCRPILNDEKHLQDFAVRKYIGDQPLFANLGIAQVEQMLAAGKSTAILDLVHKLEADGLIVHVNPLQEWLQPEGDVIQQKPIDTLKRLLDVFPMPLMVKEVGQGFGPKSMAALVKLPLEAIEFGAYGGTNFSLLENLRSEPFRKEHFAPVAQIGHNAVEMTENLLEIFSSPETEIKTRGFIVSGGIRNFLDGYYHIKKIPYKTIYAQASAFLKYALQGEEELMKFTETQIKGLEMSYAFLSPKNK